MPPRSSPTLRQRRLGTELRKMREHAGMTAPEVAAYLGTDSPKISQMESGRSGISADRLRSFAAACSCGNDTLVDALAEMAQERSRGWWDEYRGHLPAGLLDIAEMERHAHRLLSAASAQIPGIFQTSAYASAVFGRVLPPLPRHEISARTAFRLQRQHSLRARGTPVTSYIHEAALRMQFGGRSVLQEQLQSLLEDSVRPGIEIRAIPFDLDTAPSAGEGIIYACGPIPGLDTVQVDVTRGPIFHDAENHLATYRALFDRTDKASLSDVESRQFIQTIAEELER